MKSRVNCHLVHGSLLACTMLVGCDGSRPGLLGEYISNNSSTQAQPVDAGRPMLPLAAAGTLAADSGGPTSMPSAPTASTPSAPAPSAPSTTSSTPPAVMQPVTVPIRNPDYVAVAQEPVGPLDIEVDEYHCATTDLRLDEETWMTALEVVPQHVDYAFRATVSVSNDQACDALGLTSHVIFDYYPNHTRLELNEGDALRLSAGSYLNVQLHYSGVIARAPSTDSQPTEVRLWTLPKGERPKYEVVRATYHALNISIPVDAVDHEVSTAANIEAKYTPPGTEIIGIGAAAHFLGQRVTATLTAPDGSETSVIDVADWSIDARKDYLLDPSEYIPVPRGSTHRHSCFYSNRAEDQPLDRNGEPVVPQLTTFGEDARMEQCRVNVMFRHPI